MVTGPTGDDRGQRGGLSNLANDAGVANARDTTRTLGATVGWTVVALLVAVGDAITAMRAEFADGSASAVFTRVMVLAEVTLLGPVRDAVAAIGRERAVGVASSVVSLVEYRSVVAHLAGV